MTYTKIKLSCGTKQLEKSALFYQTDKWCIDCGELVVHLAHFDPRCEEVLKGYTGLEDRYTVTHKRTGRSVHCFYLWRAAKMFAQDLGQLPLWKQINSADDLPNVSEQEREKLKEQGKPYFELDAIGRGMIEPEQSERLFYY